MIWNALSGAIIIALSLATAIGIVYVAGWFALLVMCIFEDSIIPFFKKLTKEVYEK